MENDILNIILNMIYIDKYIEAYENRANTIDYPINIILKPNIKVLSDFNDEYFESFSYTLIYNSLIYAIENNMVDYTNHIVALIKSHKLKDELDKDIILRVKTTELAIKNISNKLKIVKDNKLTFNSKLNEATVKKHKNIFNELNIIFSQVYFITNYYLKLLFDFLVSYNKSPVEKYLDTFLSTDSLDEIFIKFTNGLISKQQLLQYKGFITRQILSDNYIQLETLLLENELDKYLDELDNNSDEADLEDIDEEYEDYYIYDIDELILGYLYKCLETNRFILPSDKKIRYTMLVNFLEYNSTNDKKYDIETIEGNKEKKLNLKKINPLYKFEQLNFN